VLTVKQMQAKHHSLLGKSQRAVPSNVHVVF